MTNYEINIPDSEVEYIDETSNDIKLKKEFLSFDDIVLDDDTYVIIQYEEDPETVQHKYQLIDVDDSFVTLKWLNKIQSEVLTEAPVIKLGSDEVNNPDDVNFKKLIKSAEDKEEAEKQLAKKNSDIAELKTKYAGVYDDLKNSYNSKSVTDTIELLFDKLVPPQGIADTVAGEYVRAIMRILYRDFNDGDKFFEGYGLETCGSSAQYLYDEGFDGQIESILDAASDMSDDEYTDSIIELADSIINTILDKEDLLYTPNTTDSRGYNYSYIEEKQPTYEFELYGSDDINILVDKGVLTSWDLKDYVENILSYESVYNNSETERPWSHHDTTVTVTNLTRDGYDTLRDSFERNVDRFWEDLVNEHSDELEDEEYDDDYEEE